MHHIRNQFLRVWKVPLINCGVYQCWLQAKAQKKKISLNLRAKLSAAASVQVSQRQTVAWKRKQKLTWKTLPQRLKVEHQHYSNKKKKKNYWKHLNKKKITHLDMCRLADCLSVTVPYCMGVAQQETPLTQASYVYRKCLH